MKTRIANFDSHSKHFLEKRKQARKKVMSSSTDDNTWVSRLLTKHRYLQQTKCIVKENIGGVNAGQTTINVSEREDQTSYHKIIAPNEHGGKNNARKSYLARYTVDKIPDSPCDQPTIYYTKTDYDYPSLCDKNSVNMKPRGRKRGQEERRQCDVTDNTLASYLMTSQPTTLETGERNNRNVCSCIKESSKNCLVNHCELKSKLSWINVCFVRYETIKTPLVYRHFLNSVFLLFFYVLLVCSSCSAQEDLRCFLLKGGSVQNFFVPESLAIGSVIGTLNIGGDASENGDIYLRLENTNSPVQISPNSKDLLLTEKLDKEGKNGLSHVVINVICQKRKVNDVDTRIPINIRVTDANDNSPVFIDAPYYVNVSEATVVGTKIVGDIRAVDDDQNGPYSTVQYSIAPGPHSDKFAFPSPISGDLQLIQSLDYEVESLFNLTIVAEDQGSPPMRTETFLTVHVLDSDDQNPAFNKQRYMAFLPDEPVKGKSLEVQPEPIRAEDQDKGIKARVFYSLGKEVAESSYFSVEPSTGNVHLVKNVPEDSFSQPVALYVMATQVDNPDRMASTILIVSRRGDTSTQLQFLQRHYEATVPENLPAESIITRTYINKNPLTNTRFTLERGGFGIFKISPTGSVFLNHKLDYERQSEYDLRIYVTDGEFNDTALLKVSVRNVNDWDPRFQYPEYVFFITNDVIEPGDVIGNVTVADGDNDHVALSVRGPDARMFDINSSGEILIRRLVHLNSTEAHIIAVAKDTGEPPRQSSVPVTIHFPDGFVRSLPITASSSFLLMVVFGSLVAVFTLIIVCLAVYIHKNKKFRDDNDAALPTKMSKIITNGAPSNKLDPLSPVGHQQDSRSDLTEVENPRSNGSILETSNPFRRSFHNGSLRASSISVQSNDQNSHNGEAGARRYIRNPLAMGSSPGGGVGVIMVDGGDSLSLNGSNATTTSTATAGSDSPPNNDSRSSTPSAMTRLFSGKTSSVAPMNGSVSSFCTFDGTVRATGGVPHQMRVAPIPPAPPLPPGSSSSSSSNALLTNSDCASTSTLAPNRKFSYPHRSSASGVNGGRKIVWPTSAIPKKVKKLSWEDERNNQTELNPEVSVTPMPQNKSKESPNLTVYF